jgi:cobalt-zinc-cadmium efflux system protein
LLELRESESNLEPTRSHHLQIEQRRRLRVVLTITALYFVAELITGWLVASLALLSDALHMLTDIAAICLALFTLWISSRPATSGKTYGYVRAEILGAVFNGLILWVLVAFLWFEAAQRLRNPPAVNGLPLMIIAGIGILMNLILMWITLGPSPSTRGIALKAIVTHALADLASSAGVLVAGALTYVGWRRADAAVSLLIGCLIILGSWGLIREGVDILMESVPAGVNLDELQKDLLRISGARELHDLHVWCLTSHQYALSAHAVVAEDADHDRVLSDISALLERKFNIRHMTVQLERDNRREREPSHF